MSVTHLTDAPHWVYRCYDAEGNLLYVGCTVDPERRLKGHQSKAKDRPGYFLNRMATCRLIGPFTGANARRRAFQVETHLHRTAAVEHDAATPGAFRSSIEREMWLRKLHATGAYCVERGCGACWSRLEAVAA